MVTPQWELLHTGLFCCGSFFHRSICLSLGKADFFLVGIYFQNLHVDDFANLQFIFEGIIILAAVTLDCLKYVQKK